MQSALIEHVPSNASERIGADSVARSLVAQAQSRAWINGARWDLGWLIGSALIVPVVLFFVWRGASMFATYTATYMDPNFRSSHRWLLAAITVLVPMFVVYWTIHNFQILLSVFIFSASVHVLQQNAYLVDVYRKRSPNKREVPWARWVDYGLLMVSIYPIASYKLVNSSFMLGDIQILIPPFLMTPATYYVVWIAFTTFLGAWLYKTYNEFRSDSLNIPKTVLISITTVIAFFVPVAASGERLELAFQSVNAWHSIQYLSLVWLIQAIRKRQHLIQSPFVRSISGHGKAAWRFYGFCFLTTVGLLGALFGVSRLDPLNLSFQQYYYMSVLSCLLVHYVLDGYLFAVSNRDTVEIKTTPFAIPALQT